MHDFVIELTGPGRGTVHMDGEKLENIMAVTVQASVGQPNRVTLTYLAKTVSISGAAYLPEPEDEPLPAVPTP